MFKVTARRDSDNSFCVKGEPSRVEAGYSVYEFLEREDPARMHIDGKYVDFCHLIVGVTQLAPGETVDASVGYLTSTLEDGVWLGPCDVVSIP